MKKTIFVLALFSAFIFVGCIAVDHDYETVFKMSYKTMEPASPFQEITQKYLEKMNDNNQKFEDQLDLKAIGLKDFNDGSLFKDVQRMALLKEATQNHQTYFEEYFKNHKAIIDEWEAEVDALNETEDSKFTEEFYEDFKHDFKRHKLRMSNIQFSGFLFFKWQTEFIDFMNLRSNYFLDEGRPIFYSSTTAEECINKFYMATKIKSDLFRKFNYAQKLWAKNLKITGDFGDLEKVTLNCYPASGITGEDNSIRHSQARVKITKEIQQLIMKWDKEYRKENHIVIMNMKYY